MIYIVYIPEFRKKLFHFLHLCAFVYAVLSFFLFFSDAEKKRCEIWCLCFEFILIFCCYFLKQPISKDIEYVCDAVNVKHVQKGSCVRFVCCIGKCIENRRVTNETSGKSLKCRNWIEEKPEIYSIYTKYFPAVFFVCVFSLECKNVIMVLCVRKWSKFVVYNQFSISSWYR